jgi:hypothetical protein
MFFLNLNYKINKKRLFMTIYKITYQIIYKVRIIHNNNLSKSFITQIIFNNKIIKL